MSVKDGAGRIDNGIIRIITIRKHSVDRGDGSLACRTTASPFDESRDQRHHGWRIAFSGRLFTKGQPDFPPRVRHTCQGIHDQQNILALIAIIFSDCRCAFGTANTQQGRPVGRHRNNGRTSL